MTPRLVGVHPHLVERVLLVLKAMEALGFPMIVIEGVRSTARQQELFKQGRTTVGPNPTAKRPLGRTVTNADGVRNKSNHQAKKDGLGYAVDCVFLIDGKPSWDARLPWAAYGECAKALGLDWGGDWKSFDGPHIEWDGD